ncbi:hypothetical protein DPMN_025435 [Dreissena polymorpha]|uniref:Uncharacterized protein n=1 Tax=Dreissena polymorpha TaxID=45954 RepID=A0A9D4RCJ6_DREPO|nr:hypothetical protein DPMN_025435 [Dreissena polymorpha]
MANKNSLSNCGHFFQATKTIFELVQEIIRTNVLTHEDWTIHVTLRVKNSPPNGSNDIIGTNLLTKFHGDRTINGDSIVKNAPTPGGHVFQQTGTIFILVQDMIGTNLLTKFHDDRTKNVASRKKCPTPGGHVCQPTGIIFELVQDMMGRIFFLTRKNAPPPGSHVFQTTATIFKHVQDIIETNLLTKFHEDRTINVTSRVLTRQMLTPHNAQQTKGDHKSSP